MQRKSFFKDVVCICLFGAKWESKWFKVESLLNISKNERKNLFSLPFIYFVLSLTLWLTFCCLEINFRQWYCYVGVSKQQCLPSNTTHLSLCATQCNGNFTAAVDATAAKQTLWNKNRDTPSLISLDSSNKGVVFLDCHNWRVASKRLQTSILDWKGEVRGDFIATCFWENMLKVITTKIPIILCSSLKLRPHEWERCLKVNASQTRTCQCVLSSNKSFLRFKVKLWEWNTDYVLLH